MGDKPWKRRFSLIILGILYRKFRCECCHDNPQPIPRAGNVRENFIVRRTVTVEIFAPNSICWRLPQNNRIWIPVISVDWTMISQPFFLSCSYWSCRGKHFFFFLYFLALFRDIDEKAYFPHRGVSRFPRIFSLTMEHTCSWLYLNGFWRPATTPRDTVVPFALTELMRKCAFNKSLYFSRFREREED